MPTRLKLWVSLKGIRGSCMMPMWMTASMGVRRKASSTRALRRSTRWWSISFGRPSKGRRSTPTTWVSVWSCLASARPRLPEMPVTRTDRGMAVGGGPLSTGWLAFGALKRTHASARPGLSPTGRAPLPPPPPPFAPGARRPHPETPGRRAARQSECDSGWGAGRGTR